MKKILFIYVLSMIVLLSLPIYAISATYYIDFTGGNDTANNGTAKETPWKYCPRMTTEFTGTYSHANGDVFVFKGGETWTMASTPPFIVPEGGSGTDIDTYTVDETWYTGASYVAPIIDCGGTDVMGSGGICILGSNITHYKINGFTIQNAGTGSSAALLKCEGPASVEISNNTFQPDGRHCIIINGGYRLSDISIHHNTFRRANNLIEGSQAANGWSSLLIYNNTFRGPDGMLPTNHDHLDGIHLWNDEGDETKTFAGLKIYNNLWTGNWASGNDETNVTAMIYLERRPVVGTIFDAPEIYNNRFEFDLTDGANNTNFFGNGIMSIGSVNPKIVNNTIIISVPEAMSKVFQFGNAQGIILENNIVLNASDYIVLDSNSDCNGTKCDVSFTNCDYNVFETSGSYIAYWGETPSKIDPAAWLALGNDGNSTFGSASIVSETYPANFALQLSDTVALDKGKTQTLFTTDYLGTTRPKGAAWDIGAYEYNPSTALKQSLSGGSLGGGAMR